MPRAFRLARIVVSSEALRMRYALRRAVIRAMLASIALVLLFSALGFIHVAVWYWLRETLSRTQVALIFTGTDLGAALILLLAAFRSSPGRVEREARAVRERAVEDVLTSLTISTLVMRAFEMFARSRR